MFYVTKNKECRGKKKCLSFSPPWEFQTPLSFSSPQGPQTPLSLGTPGRLINLPRNWLSHSNSHFAVLHFFFLGVVLISASCTMSWISAHSSSGTLSDLIPWIYLSLPLYNCKGFDLGHTWMWFPYFLQFKSEFGNKEFMIWVTVSSQSCFCWLYRASPALASKNIINLISVLTIWWCPCVESSLALVEEGVYYGQCILLAKFC